MAAKNDNFKILKKCKDMLLEGPLSSAIEALRQYMRERTYLAPLASSLDETYVQCKQVELNPDGPASPVFQRLYELFRQDAYRMIQDITLGEQLRGSASLAALAKPATTLDVGKMKEHFNRLKAVPSGIDNLCGEEKLDALRKNRQKYDEFCANFRSALFCYIVFTPQWTEDLELLLIDYAVNPDCDATIATMVPSAIMLGNLLSFDFRKLEALFRIYRETTSSEVRERAFVCAMFSLNENEKFWMKEQEELIKKYCSSEEDVINVLDFQKQVFYLLDTEKDTKKAREVFNITEIMERNPKLKELSMSDKFEDYPLDEILSPEEEEEISEKLEESMRRYAEMEEAGSDLYFKGFRLMKNFKFFESISNWFLPFSASNPAVRPLVEFMDGKIEIVKNLEEGTPFCSSDIYSFVLVLSEMSKEIPFIKTLISDHMFRRSDELPHDKKLVASITRRKFLQDVYRFFMLAPMRENFLPLFNKKNQDRESFLASPFFNIKQYEKAHLAISRFLAKRKDYERMGQFLKQDMPDNKESRLIKAAYQINYKTASSKALKLLDSVLAEDPSCKPAKVLKAKCYYYMERYQEAIEAYTSLMELYPQNVAVERRIAVCHIKLGEYDPAMMILYRLDYQHPDDKETMRVLTQGLFLKGSAEKALRYHEKILAGVAEPSIDSAEDFYDAAMCKWATGDTAGAVQDFAKLLTVYDEKTLHSKMKSVQEVLSQHYHIGEDDFMQMNDAVSLACPKLKEQGGGEDSPKDK